MIRFVIAQPAVEDDPETDENEAQAAAPATLIVGNKAGSALPNAGGIGTTALSVLGTTLLATGALILMLRRSRLSAR